MLACLAAQGLTIYGLPCFCLPLLFLDPENFSRTMNLTVAKVINNVADMKLPKPLRMALSLDANEAMLYRSMSGVEHLAPLLPNIADRHMYNAQKFELHESISVTPAPPLPSPDIPPLPSIPPSL